MGELASNFLKSVKVEFFLKPCMLGCADLSRYTCTFTPLQCLSAGIFRGFFLVEIADL